MSKRFIKCRDCTQWHRDGYCRPYQRIIKGPDAEHICQYYEAIDPESKIAQDEIDAFNQAEREAEELEEDEFKGGMRP